MISSKKACFISYSKRLQHKNIHLKFEYQEKKYNKYNQLETNMHNKKKLKINKVLTFINYKQ